MPASREFVSVALVPDAEGGVQEGEPLTQACIGVQRQSRQPLETVEGSLDAGLPDDKFPGRDTAAARLDVSWRVASPRHARHLCAAKIPHKHAEFGEIALRNDAKPRTVPR